MTRSINLGTIRITALNDGVSHMPPTMYPGLDFAAHPHLLEDEGTYDNPAGCFLIQGDAFTILVDAGIGPANISFPADLAAAAGLTPHRNSLRRAADCRDPLIHILDGMVRAIPLRRVAEPTEIAQAIVHLARTESSYITGAVVDMTKLWTPVRVGYMHLAHRLAMAPMTRNRAHPDGTPRPTRMRCISRSGPRWASDHGRHATFRGRSGLPQYPRHLHRHPRRGLAEGRRLRA